MERSGGERRGAAHPAEKENRFTERASERTGERGACGCIENSSAVVPSQRPGACNCEPPPVSPVTQLQRYGHARVKGKAVDVFPSSSMIRSTRDRPVCR